MSTGATTTPPGGPVPGQPSGRSTVRTVPFGTAARDALADALRDARGSSPLDPVTVVVPSALVGVTLRRALAAPGLAGVRFSSLPQVLAAAATAGGRTQAPTTSALRRARVAAALQTCSALWPPVAKAPATLALLDGLLSELDAAEVGKEGLALLDAGSGRAPAVAAVCRAYRAGTGPDDEVADAVAAVRDGRFRTPVVLHLPRRLAPSEARFVQALAAQGLLHAVLGVTGDAAADLPARAVRKALGSDVVTRVDATCEAPRATRVRVAPDPEEEVRGALRDVVAHLEGGGRPERVAVVYRSSVPYSRLLHEQLTAAGLPHHVPRQRSLAQTVAGQLLLGLLDLPAQRWSRSAVLAWLAAAPVRLPDGARAPVVRWDRLSRDAGVTRGAAAWDERLQRHEDALRSRPAGTAEGDEEQAARAAEQADLCAGLRETVAALVQECAALEKAGTWGGLAAAATAVLERWTGGSRRVERWGPRDVPTGGEQHLTVVAEQRAFGEVLAALPALAALDDLPAPPPLGDLADRRSALAAQLDRGLYESQGLGRGVLVAPLADVAGADLDLLVVVGMAEGAFPPRLREHPLLRDPERAQLGLRTTSERRTAERRDYLSALASAAEVVLTAPAADARQQRAAHPAPWFLESAPRGTDGKPLLPAAVSFQAEVTGAAVPLTGAEHLAAALLSEAAPVAGAAGLAELDPLLARGLEAVDARRRGEFGPWLGGLTLPVSEAVAARLERGRSASALQHLATCPFRWFLDKGLGLKAQEEPDEDEVSPLDRGTLLHAVLEQVVGAHLERDPDLPWSADDHARAREVLEQEAASLAAAGKAGRVAVWDVQVAQMRRRLRRFLLTDDAFRRARRSSPRAVELSFGLSEDDAAPLEVTLPSGRTLSLRGSVDRVDTTDSGVVLVLDYKSGGSGGYGAFPEEGKPAGDKTDLVDRGRRLQLPLYALLARRELGSGAAKTEAFYSFLDEGGTRRGGVVGPAEEQRLLTVLDTVTAAASSGALPARPGELGYFGFENCGFCAYDRVCSAARDDQWERVRTSPRVTEYAQLAEGPLPTPEGGAA